MKYFIALTILGGSIVACGGEVVDFPADDDGGGGSPATTSGATGGGGQSSTTATSSVTSTSASTTTGGGPGGGWWGGGMTCGGFTSGSAVCDACIQNTCCAQSEACGADPDCVSVTNCLKKCDPNEVTGGPGGSACASDCLLAGEKEAAIPAFDLIYCMSDQCGVAADCFD